jgi:tetratricopeptide (TPR) repeat protein
VPTESAFSGHPARSLRELLAQGRFQEAVDAYQHTEDGVLREHPDYLLLAATAAMRVGNVRLAAEVAAAALERFERRTDPDGRMRASNLLGVIAFETGRVADAETYFEGALALAMSLEDSLMVARTSNNLASLAVLRGTLDAALKRFPTALLGYQRLGDRRGTAESYHNLGLVYRLLGDWRNADTASAEAVRHAEAADAPGLLALALMGRAEFHLERGDVGLARQELDRADGVAAPTGDEIGAAESARLRALVLLLAGDHAGALELADRTRARAQELGQPLIEAECVAAASRALRALGRGEEAERRHREAVALFERLGASAFLAKCRREWEGESPEPER